MNWNLEGLNIEAVYLNEFEVSGTVTNSRVKYGGGVEHTVSLAEPVRVYGRLADRLLIDHETVTAVKEAICNV